MEIQGGDAAHIFKKKHICRLLSINYEGEEKQ